MPELFSWKFHSQIYLTGRHFLYLPLAASEGVTARAQEARINTTMQKRITLNNNNCFVDMDVDIGSKLFGKSKGYGL